MRSVARAAKLLPPRCARVALVARHQSRVDRRRRAAPGAILATLAGRAGGLNPGRHIVATGKHPVHAVITAMKAAGYSGNSLGEVTGDIPALVT